MYLSSIFLLLVIAIGAAQNISSYTKAFKFFQEEEKTGLGIFHGKKCSIEKHPYVVGIVLRGVFRCAGTIISKKWIITVPSCIRNDPIKGIRIVAGSNNGMTGGKSYWVDKVIYHPKFTGRLDYNYALIRIKNRFKWSRKIGVIKLAKKLPKTGTKMTVAGWGSTSPDGNYEANGMLREGMMKWYNIKNCNSIVPAPWTPRMACAYNKGKTTLCREDSGDPFVKNKVFYGYMNAYIEVGVCTRKAKPLMLTNVVSEGKWIKRITGAKFEDD